MVSFDKRKKSERKLQQNSRWEFCVAKKDFLLLLPHVQTLSQKSNLEET